MDISVDQTEGTILQRFGSTWCVLASHGDARRYLIYELRMRPLGTLNAPYSATAGTATSSPWPPQPRVPSAGGIEEYAAVHERWQEG